jgi:hypothetical protein
MKRWYDDWQTIMSPRQGKREVVIFALGNGNKKKHYLKREPRDGRYEVHLPHAHNQKKFIFITKTDREDKRIRNLVGIIDSLLFTLTSKKGFMFWQK